jgi:hypothetical protein
MIQPHNIQEYGIYDILYNDSKQYIILTNNNNIYDIQLQIENSTCIPFQSYTKIGQYDATPFIYICNYPIYFNTIILLINNTKISVNVNLYPIINNEIIISTLVRYEDDYILQFIKYYMSFGIKKFIIYDNAQSPTHYFGTDPSLNKNTNLSLVLKEYINNGNVILINWPYSTVQGSLRNRQQESQQNHTLYTFTNAKLIGFIDIDEYLNPQIDFENLDTFFTDQLIKNNILLENIGGFTILSKMFKNPYSLREDNFKFLNIFTCNLSIETTEYNYNGIIFKSYQKCFIVPKNVKLFQVHFILDGMQPIEIDPTNIYINHYIFLNKISRGRDHTTDLAYDDTIIKYKPV